jgi:predicted site-specific integrase-resolvase
VPNVPQLLTLLQVAKSLCVSQHTVRSWVRQGKLRPLRICRRLIFDPAEVGRFISEAEISQTNRSGNGAEKVTSVPYEQ